MGTAPYWMKDDFLEKQHMIAEWAKKNPPMPKQYDSMDNTTNKEVNMPKKLSDGEQNRLDVDSRVVDDGCE